MDRNEFRPVEKYLLSLRDEKKDEKFESDYKSKEFYTIIPLLLQKYPAAYVRDNLDVDGTFAIAFSNSVTFSLRSALDLYLDLQDSLAFTTYSQVTNTGFIELTGELGSHIPPLTGFWVLLK